MLNFESTLVCENETLHIRPLYVLSSVYHLTREIILFYLYARLLEKSLTQMTDFGVSPFHESSFIFVRDES